ncbi:RNA polymerase sigma-70 factor (ECF subfamily) [Streptosporangium album]|uniref:RNA polymerase sigma-70 factor (ECF subfamily) n=1 Tax=Streptosporangium album TaxID=47479 RepID=A0A7W7RXJ9_9ACTN|nr:RNA polymerase sigma factor [Streptosporangium album]MBB4939980.1 RNA polymerase sigma-70 factor (ECF subfamily) [Streptosporangium album]
MRLFLTRRREPPPVGPHSNDAELLAAVAAERVEALKLLHQRHAPWLRVRLARRCADADLVDDAIQDTFVAVWRDAHRYRSPEGEAAAWIWTIAIRRLISALRRIGAAPPVVALDDVHAAGGHRSGARQTSAYLITESAEDAVLVGVEHGDLGTALARLSPDLRAAIQATVLDGLTTREASHLLGVPEGTVKTRVMRAKAQLRGYLA